MMRRHVGLILVIAIALFPAEGLQAEPTITLKIRAILIDAALNQKPVPRLSIAVKPADAAAVPASARTNFDGMAEIQLAPGKYEVSTEPVTFEGKQYQWTQAVELSTATVSLDLSNDNATTSAAAPKPQPAHVVDELTSQFSRLRNSVVTVWSEVGRGTGFIVDDAGLVITNEHVVSRSQLNAVQFDEQRKTRAVVLASNPEKDIAVLRIAPHVFDGSIVAPLASPGAAEPSVVEGERVFTIGSPLHQRKIITSGIVSKVESRAIISDININHGNSGGPLFNSLGQVVGVTTFGDVSSAGGPGISGIVRIEEALPLLEEARKKLGITPPPEAAPLPVEPTDTFPLDAIKAAVMAEKFNVKPYTYGIGGFDVAFTTPVMLYRTRRQSEIESAKGKARRNRRSAEAIQNTYDPGHDFRNWEEYIGEYKPVLLVNARPQLREGFWSAFGRGMAMSQGMYGGPANMAFQADFYRMKLMCGPKEVEPIQPLKAAIVINENMHSCA